MIIRELFAKLGLDVDAASFAEGDAAIEIVKAGLDKIVEFAGEVIDKIQDIADSAENLEGLAQSTGVSTDALQRMGKAAALEGMSVEELSHNLVLLDRNMAKVGHGIKDPEEAFKHLIDEFSRMPDGVKKTQRAMEIFGRGGASMVQVLNNGTEALEAMRNATVMTPEQIRAGKEMVMVQRALAAQTKGLWRDAIAPLLPVITDLLRQFLAWRKANAEILKANIRQWLGYAISGVKALGAAFRFVVGAIRYFKEHWLTVAAAIGAVTAAWIVSNAALAASYTATAGAAVEAAAASIAAWLAAAAPVALVAAALAVVILLYDEIRGFFAGEDSYIADGIDKLFGEGASTAVIETARNLWTEIVEAVREVSEALSGVIDKLAWIAKWSPPGIFYRTIRWVQGKEVEGLKAIGGGIVNAINGGQEPGGGEYGPRNAPTGLGGGLLERSRLRAEAVFNAEHPMYGPDMPPVAGASSSTTVTNHFSPQITFQGPVQPDDHARIHEALDKWWDNKTEAAAQALPATQ